MFTDGGWEQLQCRCGGARFLLPSCRFGGLNSGLRASWQCLCLLSCLQFTIGENKLCSDSVWTSVYSSYIGFSVFYCLFASHCVDLFIFNVVILHIKSPKEIMSSIRLSLCSSLNSCILVSLGLAYSGTRKETID